MRFSRREMLASLAGSTFVLVWPRFAGASKALAFSNEQQPIIDAAVERLGQAVRDGEKICIYGDYDVDGMTAVAILYRLLAMQGANVDYYVPHRLEEGYGVNVEAVEKIADLLKTHFPIKPDDTDELKNLIIEK